jgi:hypothetical protein
VIDGTDFEDVKPEELQLRLIRELFDLLGQQFNYSDSVKQLLNKLKFVAETNVLLLHKFPIDVCGEEFRQEFRSVVQKLMCIKVNKVKVIVVAQSLKGCSFKVERIVTCTQRIHVISYIYNFIHSHTHYIYTHLWMARTI